MPRDMIDLTTSEEWRTLTALARSAPTMRAAFAADPDRARRFSCSAAGLFLDFSKNRITDEVLHALIALAARADLEGARAAIFAGAPINATEGRAVLHPALRDRTGAAWPVRGENVAPLIAAELAKMKGLCDAIGSGAATGYSGRPFETFVNIGIGGSDLGPQLAVEALRPCWIDGRRAAFVSNIDGQHLADALAGLDPATTLFIVASKTFTTEETMTNAASARAWLQERSARDADLARHFVAISANPRAARDFGVDAARVFRLWDWVGGRFSLWSAVGLAVALQTGFETFSRLLDGAHAMDEHFRNAPLAANAPALLALVGVWNRNFLGVGAHAVLPYDQHLARLPAYLQQAEMESNGKSRRRDGAPVTAKTAPVVFGEPGTNGQHAFFQLLHQGTDVVSADFIAAARSSIRLGDHHERLLANFLAQTEALMRGRTEEEARAAGGEARLAPHRACPGDRPTTSILMEELSPEALGALLALYEHKIFCQGVLWGINSFDQWGVELGKTLAATILGEIAPHGGARPPATRHDSSTNQLIDWINARREPKGEKR
jgi:glucose-6-phosphate isomerase